jgi:hypothetical protein
MNGCEKTRRQQAWIIALLSAAAVAVAAAGAQRTSLNRVRPLVDRGPSIERLGTWLAAIEAHAPGAADRPAATVRAWTAAELRDLLIEASSLLKLMRSPGTKTFLISSDGSSIPQQVLYTDAELELLRSMARAAADRGGPNRLTLRGALLHTDIALDAPTRAATPAPAGARRGEPVVIRFADGRQLSLDASAGQLDMARGLLDRVTPQPSRDDRVRRWYVATQSVLQRDEQLNPTLLDRGLQLFPEDPQLLLLGGSLHETFASPQVQSFIRSSARARRADVGIGSDRVELRLAESLLRRALMNDERHAEARIRLGRVLGLLGRHEDAAAELRRAAESTSERPLLYYATLFLGGELEALGRRDDARVSYERAAAIYPRAQSPWLALSQLAKRSGDRAASTAAMERVLDMPAERSGQDDPWWAYHTAQGRTADTLVDEWRRVAAAETDR